jgi:hypothetical protein
MTDISAATFLSIALGLIVFAVFLVYCYGVRLLSICCTGCCASRVLYRLPRSSTPLCGRKRVVITIDDVPFYEDTAIEVLGFSEPVNLLMHRAGLIRLIITSIYMFTSQAEYTRRRYLAQSALDTIGDRRCIDSHT